MRLNDIPIIRQVECIDIPDQCLAELQIINKDIPNDMLKYFILKSFRQFTDRSRVQLRRIEINVQPCVCDYPIQLPCGELFVSFQKPGIDCRHPEQATTESGGYQVEWDVSSCLVRITPEPCKAEPIELVVATTLSPESCQVDAKIFRRYFDAIIHGAKSFLFTQKGDEVDWADGSLASFHDQKFQAAIIAAATDKILGHTSGPYSIQTRRIM